MIPKAVIETKIDPETNHHEYRARLDANYYLSVNPEAISAEHDLHPMIEAELKAGLFNVVYGDIVKEMSRVIEVCSELKCVRGRELSDSYLLRDQIKKLENCADNIMNMCIIE